MSDGVLVVLDKWELQEGQDKYTFMEKMVTDEGITRVLVICDQQYKDKADAREGGVGSESLIISSEIYQKVDQKKFIPIVREFDDAGKECVPVYLEGRIYIDLSTEEKFFEEYEKLLRNLYERPSSSRPPLGTAPAHIFEDEPTLIITSHKLSYFKDSILQGKRISKGVFSEYLDNFQAALEDFKIDPQAKEIEIDDQVLYSITQFIPYRDEFLDAIDFICKYTENDYYFEQIYELLEIVLPSKYPAPNMGSFNISWFDNFSFILYEIFLYLVSILIRHKRYPECNIFLDDLYHFSSSHGMDSGYFTKFNSVISSLDDNRKRRLKLNRVSIATDQLRERATLGFITFEGLMQTDLILYLRSVTHQSKYRNIWYPRTMIYAGGIYNPFKLFAKAQSSKNFMAIKTLLNVEDKDDLIESLTENNAIVDFNRYFWHPGIDLERLINLENLDTS